MNKTFFDLASASQAQRRKRRRRNSDDKYEHDYDASFVHLSCSSYPSLTARPVPASIPTLVPSPRHRRHSTSTSRAILSILVFPLLLALFSTLPLASASPPCIRFADYDSINQMFIDGGPGTKVLLCPNKLYRLSGTIVFTAADQELATYGYPTGSERAILRVEGKDTATAVQGDCRRCARVGIKSVVVDGNRKKLGRMIDQDLATGLIVLGGNEGQSIKNSWLKNPRGFTAVHIREGDKVSCTGAVVDKNEIGPVGEEYDPELDGDDPEASPLGRPLADGVSIACRDSFVRDNTFYDNTDAAIVIYCSPGTLVHANHIYARSLSAMAGILLVDSTPFDGDYNGVVVKSNIIDAASRSIRVGIGIGSAVWSDDTETVLTGGTVIGNGLKGRYMGFGIAAAGLKGWTVKDNWDEAKHEGRTSARCFDDPPTPDPTALLYYSPSIKDSTFQSGFVDQQFEYVVCIDGMYDKANPPKHDLPPLPHDVEGTKHSDSDPNIETFDQTETNNEKDSAVGAGAAAVSAVAVAAPTEVTGFSTGSEVMDDILEHSQQRMLEAIGHLNRRVDILAKNAVFPKGKGEEDKREMIIDQGVLDPALTGHLEKLQRRVESLESTQQSLLDSAVAMRSAIQAWDQEMAIVTEWQYDILLDVRHKLELSISNPGGGGKSEKYVNSPRVGEDRRVEIDDHSHPEILKEGWRILSNRARLNGNNKDIDTASGGISWLKVLVCTGILGVGMWLGRRWWKRRRVHTKLL